MYNSSLPPNLFTIIRHDMPKGGLPEAQEPVEDDTGKAIMICVGAVAIIFLFMIGIISLSKAL